ncbi:U11/U12 small nuclear ribonucleoprotein 35 kDa protein-like isoform X1 [Adelges cooleyi]|uniref:U11/U12 small nuclear ribonucleoprotein 35 kDa protein-like isoform X1 n=1 Tax=Adelges cooleyi TaxID=133065 RepID=UPI0021804EA8|nr:U11/U12 small nuclear ribonucleoprotein 35 kDa protein-like isoform X1 [Adelges cooleyi]
MAVNLPENQPNIPEVKCWYPHTVVYDPIKAGSIDSTDKEPHDLGVVRAVHSKFKANFKVKGDPLCTIFVTRLSLDTTEKDIENEFCRYGRMVALRLVKDIVTGMSKRYAFIEYKTPEMALNAYKKCNSLVLNNSEILVDFECGRLLPGWKPRRLGGGFGGKKQSGQLRFGGRSRLFKRPINLMKNQLDTNKDNERRNFK